jgi:uncharacterized protein
MSFQANLHSALYVGSVSHRRLRPRRHSLRYRVFWILFDLDEIDDLPKTLRLFSRNRFNALSLYDADHGDSSSTSLRAQVALHLAQAGIDCNGGKIQLLCMPRIFGYGFNPLSIYFCYDATTALRAIVYEVHNTFGERHSYLIPAQGHASKGGGIDQQCEKAFHVSPFMEMAMTYRFRLTRPHERVTVAITAADKDGVILTATLKGNRRALTDAALLRVILTHPLLTLKVVGAIHWHALRLLLNGARLRPHPVPPAAPVTIVSAEG